MLLALISSLFGTLCSYLYKSAKNEIDISTILILRSVMQVSATTILIVTCHRFLPTKMEGLSLMQKSLSWLFVIGIGFLGGIRQFVNFSALAYIPMAMLATIVNGSPVLV